MKTTAVLLGYGVLRTSQTVFLFRIAQTERVKFTYLFHDGKS